MPHPVLPVDRAWPLNSVDETRALEHTALAALPPHTLMARAGDAVARLALAVAPHARRVLVLAGPGNNGGDALVAARRLHEHGVNVRVCLLADSARLPRDAAWALEHARGVGIDPSLPARVDADLVLDGLLGIGATRPPDGAIADAIAAINGSGVDTLAIDLPSGLDADRGVRLGDAAVRARHCLSLLTLKPGLFTAEGRDHAGRVWHDDLGVATPASTMSLIGPADVLPAPHASHKGRFGDVHVLGGAPGMRGAAILAARAALGAGSGRVRVALMDPQAPAFDDTSPELMFRSPQAVVEPHALAAATVVAGCGGGAGIGAWLPAAIARAARLVLDADALNAVAGEPSLRAALQARGRRGAPTVLTPHPLEAARLLGSDSAAVQHDRITAARSLAETFSAVVVLKGSGTVVACTDGTLGVNATGNARLAGPGTGDVLAGWIGGIWSRHGGTAADAARAAVYVHGRAADAASGHGPIPAAALIDAMVAA